MFSSPLPYCLPQEQLFFLHIPKTAGSTVSNLMYHVFAPGEACQIIYMGELVKLSPEELGSYRYVGAHMRYAIKDYTPKDPAMITFLRDPIKRVISHYHYTQKWAAERNMEFDLSFEEFLYHDGFAYQTTNHQTVYLGTDPTELPPWENNNHPVVTDEIFQRAMERLKTFTFVGIQEHFQESMSLLFRLLGWPAYEKDRHINVSSKSIKVEDLSEEIIERIRSLNEYDYALYEAGMEMFQQQLEKYANGQSIHDEANENYHRVFKEQNPATDHYTYDFNYALPGSNWHVAAEHAEFGTYRFIGPETTSYVDLPLSGDKDLKISFKVITPMTQDIIDSLTLSVDDVDIPIKSKRSGHVFNFEGVLPQSLLASKDGRVRLTFNISHTVSPQELGRNEDTRKLGPGFSQIVIEPVTAKRGFSLFGNHK